MLSTTKPPPRRPSIHIPGGPGTALPDLYSDSRKHGYEGPTRSVRFPRATSGGTGAIAKSSDGQMCAVVGRESLRVLRLSKPSHNNVFEHKSVVGRGGYRIDASRNMWPMSGLAVKLDPATTDVAWGTDNFDNKILTSARNGELVMWDYNKSGPVKYERKIKDHIRSIHQLSMSRIGNVCVTGSADGDIRIWDLRELTKSKLWIRHPTSVRSVKVIPKTTNTILEVVVGLENGTIFRWDLRKGQRGHLDRIPVAHAAPILALDWCVPESSSRVPSAGGMSAFAGLADAASGTTSQSGEAAESRGWIVSGGLDRCVKVWDLSNPVSPSHIPHKPTYTLHTSFPVRRIAWRPSYECELAIVSNSELVSNSDLPYNLAGGSVASTPMVSSGNLPGESSPYSEKPKGSGSADSIEIWDVRRGYSAKWSVLGSNGEGGVTDIEFGDSHALWAHHPSGAFSQFDLRECAKPLDAIPRVAATWEVAGSLTFVGERKPKWEVPFDDLDGNVKKKVQDREIKGRVKALGDPRYMPTNQSLGTFVSEESVGNLDGFIKLARNYIFHGQNRADICTANADLAFQAGKDETAQTWLLIGSLLTELIPESPKLTHSAPELPHSLSAPAVIPIHGASDRRGMSERRASSSEPSIRAGHCARSRTPPSATPKNASGNERSYRPSSRRASPHRNNPTPVSSTSPSPRRASSALPSLAPPTSPGLPRPGPSVFQRKDSSTTPFRTKSETFYRRPSMSVAMNNESPAESIGSHAHSSKNLRQYGEGALDESDSDGSGESGAEGTLSMSYHEDEVQEGGYPARLPSPHLGPRLMGPAHPSPLSRIASKRSSSEDEGEDGRDEEGANRKEQEEEEEEEEGSPSPSPASSESESEYAYEDGNGNESSPSRRRNPVATRNRSSSSRGGLVRRASGRGKKVGAGTGAKRKGRSGSSTLASLTAGRKLTKQESYSSIRTVTAADSSMRENTDQERSFGRDEAGREREGERNSRGVDRGFGLGSVGKRGGGWSSARSSRRTSPVHMRKRSQGLAGEAGVGSVPATEEGARESDGGPERGRKVRKEAVLRKERRLAEVVWKAGKEMVEYFAEMGDVQMCAMLALVAPEELSIPKERAVRFLDAYIDMLSRLRLHTSAAYIRKNAVQEDIRGLTALQTTVYTTCGKCQKPILPPVAPSRKTLAKGAFAYCPSCQSTPVKCAICRLPARSLLFYCPVCNHGGHQDCYRQYYTRRPMQEVPSSITSETRGRPVARSRGSPLLAESQGSVGSDDDGTVASDGGAVSVGAADTVTNVAFPQTGLEVKMTGQPCAAGCGHFCWIAKDEARSEGMF